MANKKERYSMKGSEKMKTETKEGTMQIIKDDNISIKKLKILIKGLEESIKEDKNNNDSKSLRYHELALKQSKEQLQELEENIQE